MNTIWKNFIILEYDLEYFEELFPYFSATARVVPIPENSLISGHFKW